MEPSKNTKPFRITRRTRQFVWVIPDHYGAYPPRGVSHRVSVEYFREQWIPMPKADGLNEATYIKRKSREDDPEYTVGVIHDMKGEWRWVIVKMGLLRDGERPLESSVTYPTREKAMAGGRKLARNCGFKLASESQREAAGTADEKPDGQAENVNMEAPNA